MQKPTDLDLHCLQRQGISGFSGTRVSRIVIISASSQGSGNDDRRHVNVVIDQVLSVDQQKGNTDLKDLEKRSIDGPKRKMALKDVLLRKN